MSLWLKTSSTMKPPKTIYPKNMYTYQVKEMIFVSKFKRNSIKFCIFMALFLFGILITLLPFIILKINEMGKLHVRHQTDLKYIFFWKQPRHKNPFRREYFNEFENGQKSFIDQKCPHINCYITYNRSFFGKEESNFDAVVFDVHDITKSSHNDINFTRTLTQKYIFRSHESAEKYPVCNPLFEDFFTWTWTYKLDSDIPHPFIGIYDENNKMVGPNKTMKWVKVMNHTENIRNKLEEKIKGVAWIVTKCRLKNKHQAFVTELRKELKGYNYSVDVYGPCGDRKCPSGSLSKCYKMVEEQYYFQMVLEDSFAEDYVGENIVKALSYVSIPIVLGGADYSRFLPPGTYINAQAFDIKKLGALIDYLIKNPLMYEYFFDWKNHYFYTVKHRSQICGLCAMLNSHFMEEQKPKSNFRSWWNPHYDDICQRIHLMKLFNT